MSEQAVIDSLEFARTAQSLSGTLPVARFARLAESLTDHAGTVAFSIVGGVDAWQRPKLHITVRGDIHLRCQRCLRAWNFHVETDSDVLVLKDAGVAEELEDLDGIPADAHTDVAALIEDEVLLALPVSPRHPEGQCKPAFENEITQEEKKASPFAVLAKLKKD